MIHNLDYNDLRFSRSVVLFLCWKLRRIPAKIIAEWNLLVERSEFEQGAWLGKQL